MKRLLKYLVGTVPVVLVLSLLLGEVAYAIGNPDYVSIGDVYVFEDVLETGDILVYVRYDASYGSDPSEDPEDTWQMAIFDTDGSSVLFTRPLNYYQHNIISIYLDADTNTLVSGGEYVVRIMGMPSVFGNLTEDINMETATLSPSDWIDSTLLGAYMIDQAQILEDDWDLTLLTDSNKLNSTGAAFFTEAIPGLGTMDPSIFQTTTQTYTYSSTNWTREGINQTKENLPVSLNSTISGLNALFGVTDHNIGGFSWFLLFGLVLGGATYAVTRRPDVSTLVGVIGAFGLGGYMGIAEGMVLMAVVSIGMILIFLFAILFIIPRWG